MTNRLLQAVQENDLEAMGIVTKLLAHEVRNRMEDFHVEHLSDKQMAKLNPLVREGIFNALFAIANYDRDSFSRDFVNMHLLSVPEYWETPELDLNFRNALEGVDNDIVFKSAFLNEQFEIGNIYSLPNKKYIRLKGSYEFAGVEYESRKKHKDKITYQLRKEGYQYDYNNDSYYKV